MVLRGGSDSYHSSAAIHACLVAGLVEAGLPEAAISRAPFAAREAVGEMLAGLGGALDVIVPRGGKSLVERVQREARVPVFAHLEGVVHVYVDGAADLDKAIRLVVNSKMRRTGVCGAAETLLIARAAVPRLARPLLDALIARRLRGARRRGDLRAACRRAAPATDDDWRTEYLDAVIAVGVVDGLDAAIDHIETYGSHHTDCIVTEDRRGGRALPERGRFRDRAAQRLDPIRRRRRIRLRRRDRHRHRPHARARAGRASSSSARSNIACAATGRRGRERAVLLDLRAESIHCIFTRVALRRHRECGSSSGNGATAPPSASPRR